MKIRALAAAVCGLALAACATTQAPAPEGPGATIPFASLGGIKDWKAEPGGTLLIEGYNGKFYRATFFGSCSDVRFAETIGFKTDATGGVDKYSGVQVGDRYCPFRALEETIDPKSVAKAAPSTAVESGALPPPK